jgi:hypothetical protein
MSYRSIISLMPKTSVDADAQAFLTAAAITDPTISSSIDKLVVDLKSAGVWTKMKAIYPMVGGTAATHKFNLKDPRDLDAAFRLQFFGGVTHNSNGVTFNGLNGYADTFYNESTIETANNTHRAVYDKSTSNDNASQLGSFSGGGASRNYICTNYSGFLIVDCYNTSGGRIQVLNNGSAGFWVSSRLTNTDLKAYKNGTQIGSASGGAGTQPNVKTFIGAHNNSGTPQWFTNHNLAFASMGDGLTATEATNYRTAVQTFQTSLGRQV